MKTRLIDINLCYEDPENPRFISRVELENLIYNIKLNPNLAGAKPCLAYEIDGKFYIYSGAQRLKAFRSLGIKEIPVRVDTDITEGGKINDVLKKQRMLTKNEHFGETDYEVIANKAPVEEIQEMKIPVVSAYISNIFGDDVEEIDAQTFNVIDDGRDDSEEDGILGITLEFPNDEYVEFIEIFEELRKDEDTDISEFTINALRSIWNQ